MVTHRTVTLMPHARGPRNTSAAEQAMRRAVDAWGRARWGDDMRVIHELAMGDRRIDMVFVLPGDLIGVEIKGPTDSVAADRVEWQLREYRHYLPEVWLIAAAKWERHAFWRKHLPAINKAVVREGQVVELPPRTKRQASRDDLCCSRLLELLWTVETYRIAKMANVPYEYAPGQALPAGQVKGTLARLLTGQEIVRYVCGELRARPLTGMASDEPLSAEAARRSI